jgi:hypothetical protein
MKEMRKAGNGVAGTSAFPSATWERGENRYRVASCALEMFSRAPGQQVARATHLSIFCVLLWSKFGVAKFQTAIRFFWRSDAFGLPG